MNLTHMLSSYPTVVFLFSCLLITLHYFQDTSYLIYLFLLLNKIIDTIDNSVTDYFIIFAEIFNCCLLL